jgi:hypothetical protein
MDGDSWMVIDRQTNNQDIRGLNQTAFAVANLAECHSLLLPPVAFFAILRANPTPSPLDGVLDHISDSILPSIALQISEPDDDCHADALASDAIDETDASQYP